MDSNVSKLIIRQAAGDDVHEMAELDKICFSVPWSEASFLHEVTENGLALYIVAELEGETCRLRRNMAYCRRRPYYKCSGIP